MATVEDYQMVLYRQNDGSWAAYLPALPGCQAVMDTRAEVLDEIALVFEMIREEFEERGETLPADKELVCA